MDAAANSLSSTRMRQVFLLVVAQALASGTSGADSVATGDTFPPQLYEVTTETVMPHLEENLRYTTTRARRCLAHLRFAAAFPILGHPALQGCTLTNETRRDATLSYVLVCTGGHGTTGGAIWQIDDARIHGTLNVKLGGKNMTFSQRVTALPRGICSG
jgi:hypothetical protein